MVCAHVTKGVPCIMGVPAFMSENALTVLSPAQTAVPETDSPLILALPKGRILKAAAPLLHRAGIVPRPDFNDEKSRLLRFETNDPGIDVVRVRSFDVATFVAFGGAQIGICGADVLMEFDYPEIYAPLDLGIGGCRISIAQPKDRSGLEDNPNRLSQVRVATKYPSLTRRHFAARGINASIVHLHGAMELAPVLDLSHLIVDLVDTGSTLRANGLEETHTIAHITSRLIVNRTALKTQPERITAVINRFRAALASNSAQAKDSQA
ncbi:ATP phosphoribosyltransferase [Komagataeibacter oboediens]|uniref:ATP phosphoribosyltransferase n=1 Tax=Komagataeibacter oboediens TaxID=65958 RepID=A0ABS5SR84_9PROT|nr:ATP phosphoribosyltransferase [Komagataeibacter oboediens]MBL7234319.1 ATP phosphoribosyltransferase [Komagataeibacter oboediens]MBT0676252.1 ATP phosphoribosyltransferase [Komagataeibacter oboediens]MBT0679439.1 ATP phosphoribosyltransferase [Komagataeibacter oboediens]